MGLDTWVRVKTVKDLGKQSTGVCSGLFGMTTKEEGTQEVGYFRNCWFITNLLLTHSIGDTSATNVEIDINCIDEVEKVVDKLLACEFDDEGYILIPKGFSLDIVKAGEGTLLNEDFFLDDAENCFGLDYKLQSAKYMIDEIKSLRKEDPNLKLYLSYWY